MDYYGYTRSEAIDKALSLYGNFIEGLSRKKPEELDADELRELRFLRITGKSLPEEPDAPELTGTTAPAGTDSGAETRGFLESALTALSAKALDDIPKEISSGLLALLRKFEVTGKLHSAYEGGIGEGKARGRFSDTDNYVLLSACLLLLYKKRGNPKLLNTVLKLNDLIERMMEEGIEPMPRSVLIYALKEETGEVEKLYGSFGLRLFSDR